MIDAWVNGQDACNNDYLLNTTLKQLWGFQGFVTSDYAALHDVSGAVDGTDQEQPFADSFGTTLEQDVQNGTIPRAVLNTMVSRMLTEMFRFGIIDHPPTGTPSDPVTTPAHVAMFGLNAYVPRQGPGGVPVACFESRSCRVTVKIQYGNRAVSNTGPEPIAAAASTCPWSCRSAITVSMSGSARNRRDAR